MLNASSCHPKHTPPLKRSRAIAMVGIAALVTACGFIATPPLWKNWASEDAALSQTNLRSALDAQGNTWHEFRDAEGTHLRLVDSGGVEQWRQTLAVAADVIVPNSQGAITAGNGLMNAFDLGGNIRWSQTVPALVNVSTDMQNRVVTVSRSNLQITVTGFSENGAQRWQTQFSTPDQITYSLVTTRNDGTSVIMYETNGTQASLATRTVNSDGILSAEKKIGTVDLTIGRIPWLETNGEQVMAFSRGTLYALNDDGSLAWQYAAPAPTDNTSAIEHCSKPGIERTVCHRRVFNQVRLEWIDNAGHMVTQKTIKSDTALALFGNGLDRWVLVEVSAPDEYNGAGLLDPKPQYVARLHMFDELGNGTGTINLKPASVYAANCVGIICIPMSFKEPAEFYFNGGVAADQVIVTGGLMQDTATPVTRYRSFVAAYELK